MQNFTPLKSPADFKMCEKIIFWTLSISCKLFFFIITQWTVGKWVLVFLQIREVTITLSYLSFLLQENKQALDCPKLLGQNFINFNYKLLGPYWNILEWFLYLLCFFHITGCYFNEYLVIMTVNLVFQCIIFLIHTNLLFMNEVNGMPYYTVNRYWF